jgi:GTPase SAR1 family protein
MGNGGKNKVKKSNDTKTEETQIEYKLLLLGAGESGKVSEKT